MSDPLPEKYDPYAAFRSPNYRLFMTGMAIGTIGMQMQNVAVGWEIYQWTGSKLSLGWVGLALALPTIVMTLPAGHLADRFDRRNITAISLIFTAMFAALIGVVSIAFHRQMISVRTAEWSMYGLLACSGTSSAIGRPARAALLPQIVPREVFANAVTWNSSIFEVTTMVGPALGGLAIAWYASSAYFFNAAAVIVYALFLTLLTIERRPQPVKRASGLRDFLAGAEFVYRTKLLLAVMTLDLFAVLLGGATFLLPVFANDILGVGPTGFGWLRAAPGFGAFATALIIAHSPPINRAGRALLFAVAGFGLATIVFGLSKSFTLSFIMLLLTGAFDNVSVVVRHTLVQILTPDEMRGRVSAVNQVFIGSSNELGGLESGLTAHWWGPIASVVSGGIGTIVVVIGSAFLWPQIRAVGRLTDVKPIDAPAPPPEVAEIKLTEDAAREGTD